MLDVLPQLLADVDEYRSLWGPEDAALTNTEHLFDAGRITIEEPELDLAVVRGPSAGEWHPMAVHTRTAATRLLLVHGPRVEFRYRYESWVQMASRRPALRVDLTALAGELTREDGADGRWRFEGVEHITPREGGASILTPEDIPPPAGGGAAGRRTGVESIPVTSDTTPGAAAVPRRGGVRAGQCRLRRVPIQRRPVPAVQRRHPWRSAPVCAPRGLPAASGRVAARARSSRSSACGSSPAAPSAARWSSCSRRSPGFGRSAGR